jgi:prophage tail gpP-like protein/N-acetylmuramoyl-L-alanine amidase
MRDCQAIITVATGRSGTQQLPVQRVESYTTSQSIDSDADSFQVQIGDPRNQLGICLERDNEVRVQLFLDDDKGRLASIFNGIVDTPQFTEDFTLSLEGRDTPSSLAVDSDATPGRWKHVPTSSFLKQRAQALGITQTAIADMSTINSLYTDGSEKEWAFWYRVARMKGMYMWSDSIGRLIIDKLAYSLAPTYSFGNPPRGEDAAGWMRVTNVSQTSNKQQRIRRVFVYGDDAKKGKVMVQQGVDTSIAAWRRQPLTIMSDPQAKTNADLKQIADEEIFESIVGAQELELTIQDTGVLIQQNRMSVVNLPSHGIENETWFVAGVQRQGGPEGLVQIVRLRERGFALSKRVPDAPAIKNPKDSAQDKPIGSIAGVLSEIPGIKWADSFVRATNEFGVPNGWDFSVFLGVLMAICDQETGGTFNNCREGDGHTNWQPYDQWVNSGDRLSSTKNSNELLNDYRRLFANAKGSEFNPYPREAGVGPMQLTSLVYKQWADQYGWNGKALGGELDGGRWNPDSNIRAAARALIEKLKANPPADPTNPDSIWIGVERYNGRKSYANAVRAKYEAKYKITAATAVGVVKSLPPGSTTTSIAIPGHGELVLPGNTPDEARKAINFCLRRLGEPYEWGGSGPHYDCSSLVTAALASASANLRALLNEPSPGNHGETTYTLPDKGRVVKKDNLRPGDLVFFHHGGTSAEHVGMYMEDGLMVHDPKPGDFVKISSINDSYYQEHWWGARRYISWPSVLPQPGPSVAPDAPVTTKTVMIQAGHDTGTHADQPYGHTGESGATGEQAFTKQIRDIVIGYLESDPRFKSRRGTAWDASAGATSDPADDINFTGDMFLSLHYDRGAAGSGYFFGYTRGATDGRPASVATNSARLANAIAGRIDKIDGAPPRLLDNANFGGTPAGATGWGYYAWGSTLRAAPNDVDHTPGVPARVVMECGRASDTIFLDFRRKDIGKAVYRAICDYYGFEPVGG